MNEKTGPQETDLAALADELAIRALLDRYTDAVNRRDWDAYRACWTNDGIWELGAPINGRHEGIEAIMKEVRRAVESQELFVQMNHAVAVTERTSDAAKAHVTLNEIGKADPKQGGALPGVTGMNILALYTDDIIKQAGAWKFSRRRYDVLLIDFTEPKGQIQPVPKS